ncbi:hypothetical protein GCM10018773_02130 [Streptomyces candidus]|nr:hypothetical protein GCM10018773_02130 [Streptomyces candidus]
MQRVREPVRWDRPAGGDQGLRGDLAAEDAGDDRRAAHAPEDVLLDLLQVEQIEQGVKCLSGVRGVSPGR